MRISLGVAVLLVVAISARAQQGSYLFVWSGDQAKKASDFLAVINADPTSAKYGQVVASIAAPGGFGYAHHTELQMPADGFLLANSFGTGRTMLFDLRDPRHPTLATSFGGVNGLTYPHTFLRLPDNHVLVTFQYAGAMDPKTAGGGVAVIDERGKPLRSASAMDPAASSELIRPYSAVVIPKLDRLVSTNHSMMMNADGYARSVQVWRFSDLKLLKTIPLPAGPHGYEQLEPGEPRVLDDGKTVLIHTFMCGLYEMNDVDTDHPRVHFLHTFEGVQCGVPLLLGHFWIQTLSTARAVVVEDISNPEHMREVSRVTFDSMQFPHWISADSSGHRLVVDSGGYGADRVYILNFNPETGQLQLDERFRDSGSDQPGFNMDGKSWPHGFQGDAFPHGAVFSLTAAAAKYR
jgi:hypothetical protein